MLGQLNEARNYLIEKFGTVENVVPGVYAVPTNTSKGPAFMRVVIGNNFEMSDFKLFWDIHLKCSWQDPRPTFKHELGTIGPPPSINTQLSKFESAIKTVSDEQDQALKEYLDPHSAFVQHRSKSGGRVFPNIPRRSKMWLLTPVESDLHKVMVSIEQLGCGEKLTEAIVLLQKAQSLVSDYIDQELTKQN